MGIDVRRFSNKVHEEVICCLCRGVLDTPVEITECGHLFCEDCLIRWLESPVYEMPICPVDRNEIDIENIRPAPECILNYIGKLSVKCEFAHLGCIVDVPLRELKLHRRQCPLNPQKPIPCTRGCGVSRPPAQMVSHHCDFDLCQDALLWNDIIEAAKLAVKRKRFVETSHHNVVTGSYKSVLSNLTAWLTTSDSNKKHSMQPITKAKTTKTVKIAI